MKRLLFIIPILGILIYAFSSNKPAVVSKEGINFLEGTWYDALKQSSEENKLIFLDASTSWCGHCKKMKRKAFSDKTVGAYFNANFINLTIDAEKGEGIALARKYGVNSYPTLIIIDKNEKIILYTEGYMNADKLLGMGQEALKKQNNF